MAIIDKLYFIGINDIVNFDIVAISTSEDEAFNYKYKDKKTFVRTFEVEDNGKKGNFYEVVLIGNLPLYVRPVLTEETLLYEKTDIGTRIIVKAKNEKKAIKKAKKSIKDFK